MCRFPRRLRVVALVIAAIAGAQWTAATMRAAQARLTDDTIPRVSVSVGPGARNPFDQLLDQAARLPMGIEEAPAAFEPPTDSRVAPPPTPPVVLGPGRLSDALHVLLERVPGYEMTTPHGVINIAPSSLLHDPAHFMNVPIDHFEVHSAPIHDAFVALRRKLNPAYPDRLVEAVIGPDGDRLRAAQAMFNRRVTLVVDGASPREILNRLVLAHGELRWTVEYTARLPTPVPDSSESNATISLWMFPPFGVRERIGPGR
jgi:hypothetical protein